MNTKAPTKPPTVEELRALGGKPTPSPPPPLPGETAKAYTMRIALEPLFHAAPPLPGETAKSYTERTGNTAVDITHSGSSEPEMMIVGQRPMQAFPVRVALVCPHCSSYMQRLGSGDLMTCKTEGCRNHLKRFRLPVLMAEEVGD